MAVKNPQPSGLPDESSVLTKAVTRAATLLGLTQRQVAETLGLSGPTASRLFTGKYRLSPTRAKEWELAVLFVRLFRSLDSIVGEEGTARAWLNSDNKGLNARPIELISQTEGLVRVVHYLDASRGLS